MVKVKTWLDDKGIQDILVHNNKLEAMEREIMERELSRIRAEFFQQFGFNGEFQAFPTQTKPGQRLNRLRYSIAAVKGSRTAAVLSKNPGWLNQFMPKSL